MSGGDTKLRIKVNSNALIKLAGLVSNTVILSANAYLLGHNIRRQARERRTQVIADKLQFTAEIASAVAGVAKVIVSALDEQ